MLASGYFKFLLLLFLCASELFLLLFVVTVCKLRTSLSRHMHTYSTRPQNFFWRLMKGNVFYNYLSVNWIGLNNKIWIKKKKTAKLLLTSKETKTYWYFFAYKDYVIRKMTVNGGESGGHSNTFIMCNCVSVVSSFLFKFKRIFKTKFLKE